MDFHGEREDRHSRIRLARRCKSGSNDRFDEAWTNVRRNGRNVEHASEERKAGRCRAQIAGQLECPVFVSRRWRLIAEYGPRFSAIPLDAPDRRVRFGPSPRWQQAAEEPETSLVLSNRNHDPVTGN